MVAHRSLCFLTCEIETTVVSVLIVNTLIKINTLNNTRHIVSIIYVKANFSPVIAFFRYVHLNASQPLKFQILKLSPYSSQVGHHPSTNVNWKVGSHSSFFFCVHPEF